MKKLNKSQEERRAEMKSQQNEKRSVGLREDFRETKNYSTKIALYGMGRKQGQCHEGQRRKKFLGIQKKDDSMIETRQCTERSKLRTWYVLEGKTKIRTKAKIK